MGLYYDHEKLRDEKLRAIAEKYGVPYKSEYDNHSWSKKQKDKYENDRYDDNHSWDRERKYDNPIVNVDVNVNCCNHKKESAFRASKATNQPVAANTLVKVSFQNEQFDLGNEYNPVTSTFIPKTDGVYNLATAVNFLPTVPNVSFKVFIGFLINGLPADGDSEFQGIVPTSGIVATTDTRQLNAGDIVEVFASANVPGEFLAGTAIRFSAFQVAEI